MTGHPGGKPKQPKILKDFEKIAEEAYAEGRDPVLCLRYWNPESRLADRDGWVDLTVRLTSEDAERGKVCTRFHAGPTEIGEERHQGLSDPMG